MISDKQKDETTPSHQPMGVGRVCVLFRLFSLAINGGSE
ncbi:hypothetical protein B835_436 [Enterococcus mundtii 3F]|nr:hypothetical protein [Enterococcus mundtii 3F]